MSLFLPGQYRFKNWFCLMGKNPGGIFKIKQSNPLSIYRSLAMQDLK